MHALRSIVRQEGWQALYAGLSPALLGAGLSWGIYFAAYDNAKARWQTAPGQALPAPLHLLSAAEAGCLVGPPGRQPVLVRPACLHLSAVLVTMAACACPPVTCARAEPAVVQVCLVTNPIWVIKTRLQLQRRRHFSALAAAQAYPPGQGPAAMPYLGFRHAVRQIARHEGLGGFYRGLGPSLIMVCCRSCWPCTPGLACSSVGSCTLPREHKSPGQTLLCMLHSLAQPQAALQQRSSGGAAAQVSHGAIQFMVYEELKQACLHFNAWGAQSRGEQAVLSSLQISLIGAASKLAATVSTYPLQVGGWAILPAHRTRDRRASRWAGQSAAAAVATPAAARPQRQSQLCSRWLARAKG